MATSAAPAIPGGPRSAVRRHGRWLDAAALLLCAVALGRGVWVTADLSWPSETDQYRDMAIAETIVRGTPFADPFFAGERFWYPPLFPWLVGAISVVTGVATSVVDTHLGTWVNIFAPVAFYLLVRLWFGKRPALFSLAAYLFAVTGPFWLAPSFSPWLLSGPSSHGLFFASFALVTLALRHPSWGRWAGTGAMLGLTFLAHLAPAVLLVAALLIAWAITLPRQLGWLPAAGRLAAAGATAIAVASPQLLSIVGHYHLVPKNWAPLVWSTPLLNAPFWELVLRNWLAWPLIAAAVLGLLLLAIRTRTGTDAPVLALSWIGVAAAIYLYEAHVVAQSQAGAEIRTLLLAPPHHFLFHLRAGLLVALGVGVDGLVTGCAALAGWWWPRGSARREDVQQALTGALVAGLLIVSVPSWWTRSEFTAMVQDGRQTFAEPEWRSLISWMRTSVDRHAVFFAADSPALSIVGATGHQLVSLDRFFSNPYVDPTARHVARQQYWAALEAGDCSAARQLAIRYGATHVMHARSVPIPKGTCGLETVFEIPDVRIDRIH